METRAENGGGAYAMLANPAVVVNAFPLPGGSFVWVYGVGSVNDPARGARYSITYQNAGSLGARGEWPLPVALSEAQRMQLVAALQKYRGQPPELVKAALDGGAFDSILYQPVFAQPFVAPVAAAPTARRPPRG